MSILTSAVSAAEGGESPAVLSVPLDEFIIAVLAFFIVFGLLAKFALPGIKKTLAERTDAIEGGIERAAKAEAEAQSLAEQYREQISGAHDEAAAIRAKAEDDARSIVAEARQQAEVERSTIAARGEAQLDAERSQTLSALRQDVGGMAVDLAGRIVGESLSDDARSQAVVDRFIADLEAAPAAERN